MSDSGSDLIGFIAAADNERTTGCLWLREHVGDGDSTGHMALDDELHRVSDSQDCGGRMRPRSVWNGFRADDRPG